MITKGEKLILEALIEFEKQANYLIGLLADKFKLNLIEESPFNKLITRTNNLWEGSLKGNWNYQFHGDACRFENNESGQVVDVKINRNGNYGSIHNFGLLHFIETTEKLNYILKELNTEEVIFNTLIELEEKELIIDVGEPPFNTKIVNKGKIKIVFDKV